MSEKTNPLQTHFEQLMRQDAWHANDVGLRLSADRSEYWLPFHRIQSPWLKKAAKQFIYRQSLTKKYNTCRAYLKGLSSFDGFIIGIKPDILPADIDRKIIIDYLHYLSSIKGLKPTTKNLYLVGLKYFFEVNLQERWVTFQNNPIIYNEDFSKVPKALPKFIPESVLEQLLKYLPALSEQHQHLMTIFLETGRRCGEIFTLEYDCLHKDNEGDYFIKVNDRKMTKSYMIPITQHCAEHIQQQQAYVCEQTSSRDFLFITRYKGKIQGMKSGQVKEILNKLAKEKNIVDANGEVWHFHFHQFRHTVGTRMINSEVPQHIVQRFLGHESAEMTARYATVHDVTLKKEFIKFQKQLSKNQEDDFLQEGLSDEAFLADYTQQLEATKSLVKMAQLKGWKKQLDMNLKKQKKLEKTIAIIEEKKP